MHLYNCNQYGLEFSYTEFYKVESNDVSKVQRFFVSKGHFSNIRYYPRI